MFPAPTPIATVACARCGTATRVDRVWAGAYGEDCAEQLGLKVPRRRLRWTGQTGPDLLDEIEPEDCCDGFDR